MNSGKTILDKYVKKPLGDLTASEFTDLLVMFIHHDYIPSLSNLHGIQLMRACYLINFFRPLVPEKHHAKLSAVLPPVYLPPNDENIKHLFNT